MGRDSASGASGEPRRGILQVVDVGSRVLLLAKFAKKQI
jgi:hypothetical protein